MNRLKEKIKKKWKVMTGLTAMFMLVFLVGFAVKAHFTTKAADARTYTIYDSAGKVLTSGQDILCVDLMIFSLLQVHRIHRLNMSGRV